MTVIILRQHYKQKARSRKNFEIGNVIPLLEADQLKAVFSTRGNFAPSTIYLTMSRGIFGDPDYYWGISR